MTWRAARNHKSGRASPSSTQRADNKQGSTQYPTPRWQSNPAGEPTHQHHVRGEEHKVSHAEQCYGYTGVELVVLSGRPAKPVATPTASQPRQSSSSTTTTTTHQDASGTCPTRVGCAEGQAVSCTRQASTPGSAHKSRRAAACDHTHHEVLPPAGSSVPVLFSSMFLKESMEMVEKDRNLGHQSPQQPQHLNDQFHVTSRHVTSHYVRRKLRVCPTRTPFLLSSKHKDDCRARRRLGGPPHPSLLTELCWQTAHWQ